MDNRYAADHHPKRSIFGVTKIHPNTNGTSINTTPVIIGVHGDNGADGNPTGVTESEIEPADPYVGMLWKNTGTSGGRVQGAVYRWDGSSWGLFKFTASNIEAETFKGFDFNIS